MSGIVKIMDKHLSFISTEFGFSGFGQLCESLFRPHIMNITIPIAVFGSAIETIFGLQPVFLAAFIALLTLELVSGIFASWIEGKVISSKRMKAFLMMIFVWLTVLFILNSFKSGYKGTVGEAAFSYLFNAVIIFVNTIYFRSIWENAGRIMERKYEFSKLAAIFSKKINEENDKQGSD